MQEYPISPGCKKGDLIFVSGQVAADADGNVTTYGDHAAQSRYAWNRIREIVEMAGGRPDDIVDVMSFHQDARGIPEALLQSHVSDVAQGEAAVDTFTDKPRRGGKIYFQSEVLGDAAGENVPAWTGIGTSGLYKVGMIGSCKVIADLSPGRRSGKTPGSIWWKILPISGGTKKEGGHLLGISGQVASDGDGNIVTPGDVAGQARYCLNRISEVLEAFDASMEDVAEIISFHKDVRGWETVMNVGREYFQNGAGPAWTPVGTPGLTKDGLPARDLRTSCRVGGNRDDRGSRAAQEQSPPVGRGRKSVRGGKG